MTLHVDLEYQYIIINFNDRPIAKKKNHLQYTVIIIIAKIYSMLAIANFNGLP